MSMMFPPGGPGGPGGGLEELDVPADNQRGKAGGNPVALMKQALDLVDQATDLEPDEEDTLQLEEIQSAIQKYVASQQKLQDQATGAGPGAKLIRKASQGPESGGPGY